MQPKGQQDDTPTSCRRCGRELQPGDGNFYVINILAIADPTPPSISAEDLLKDIGEEIARILEEMKNLSEQDALDQVYRRVTLFLCTPCYERWIDNPTG